MGADFWIHLGPRGLHFSDSKVSRFNAKKDEAIFIFSSEILHFGPIDSSASEEYHLCPPQKALSRRPQSGVRMVTKARIVLVASIAIMLGMFSTAVYSQSGSATLQGTVTDPTGAVIPNARIHITSLLTGVSRDVVSNNSGIYSAPDLSPGRYEVSTSAEGFTKRVQTDVVLTVGAMRDLDIPLQLSAAQTTITVNTSSNQVNSVDTSMQGVVDGKQTRDLPLNGRDWTTLATLNTGVSQILTQYPGAATATTRLSRGLGAQLTIGGNRPQQNSYRLDGVNINDYANGGPGSVSGATLGVDAVQEFSVITSDAPAQYGRMSGGVVNSITRQGTNQFHGSVV